MLKSNPQTLVELLVDPLPVPHVCLAKSSPSARAHPAPPSFRAALRRL